MAPTRAAFKALPGKFSSAQWRAGNRARVASMASSARAASLASRRQIRRSGYALARRVALNREKKYIDVAVATANFDTTGTTTFCTPVPQGDTVSSRIGKKISLKAIQIKGKIVAAALSVTKASLLLVYDRNPNAATPAITDVLASASSLALSNRQWSERFKIIRRWNYAITGSAGSASASAGFPNGGVLVDVDEYVRLGGREVEWTTADTTGSGSAVVKGALYLFAIGDAANGTATPTGVFNLRTDYED